MKKTILCTYLLIYTIQLPAQDLPDTILTFADAAVTAYSKAYPGVSVSVSGNGAIVWNKTVGFRDLEAREQVSRSTKFNIYSTSKFISGLAFLKLAYEQGLDFLDQDIRQIDPSLPLHYEGITIRHLLTHTSGIRHYKGRKDWIQFSDLRCDSPADAVAYFADDPLKDEPGGKSIYTTFGMTLASHLLEKITGKKYEDALNGLIPFSEKVRVDDVAADKAKPYIRKGKQFEVIKGLSAECKYGGGGLIASSDQLVEAGQFLYDGSIAPLEEIKRLLATQYPPGEERGTSFGMGNGITASFNGQKVLYANMGGASPGGRSYLLVLADLQVAVAITTNCEGDGEQAYQLSMALAKKFAGLE